jgi:LysM repeat protein
MSGYYKVQQGDHLSSIAKAFGFSDYQTIWNDPNNADLKAQRVNPNVLYPGDLLFIPDKVTTQYPRPSDQKHQFVKNVPQLKLVLVLEDLYEKPIANAACTLQISGNSSNVTTDGTGKLQQNIAADAHDAVLTIQDPQTPFQDTQIPIKIGNLDPVDELSGQVARLNNLGYFPGDGTDAAALESAIEEFQCDNSLTVDGICGPQTQAALKQVHGC